MSQPPDWAAHAAAAFQPHQRRFPTPGDLARHLDPRTVQTPALELIDQALVDLVNTPDGRLIITMPPQEGKSTRVAGDFPVWTLLDDPDARIAVASYAADLAIRNGRAIRRRITDHADLGLRVSPDNASVTDWTLAGHEGGVLSVGIGSGFTGRPAEGLVIDDPIKDQKDADSDAWREQCWDWWQTVASARLAPGAFVVMILTRWHKDDLAGRLVEADEDHEWRVLNIPAQADHRPEQGDTDVLGREPGEFMQSARGRTVRQWERRKHDAGPRAWAALYQGRPSPEAGGIFNPAWWQTYDAPLWIEHADDTRVVNVTHGDAELIQSWDLTFKDTKGSDYVVGQVWLRDRVNAYLLEQVRGRWSFTETCRQMLALSARWPQATAKLVEDKANGPAVLNALRHRLTGLIPVEPEGSKYARASAVSPLVEAGNVFVPSAKLAPWVEEFVEEHKGFPNAAHDDQVDALSQALHRLLLVRIVPEGTVTADDLIADFEYAQAAALTPY